jgi:hypothetical protein
MSTLVSKKLPGIRLVSVKLEVGGEPTAEGAETLQQLFAPRLAGHAELPGLCYMDLDLVAFTKFQSFNDSCGKADCEAIAPFGDLHSALLGYTLTQMYIHCRD